MFIDVLCFLAMFSFISCYFWHFRGERRCGERQSQIQKFAMATPFTEHQKKVAEKLVENGVIEKAQPNFKICDSETCHK